MPARSSATLLFGLIAPSWDRIPADHRPKELAMKMIGEPIATPILAIDLGKYKSVSCF